VTKQDVARFLRDRRADLRPAHVGLPTGPRRRTPGLRREEVAGLANISVEYYARIEQARGPHPSPRILDAIASALCLNSAERAQLLRMAGIHPEPVAGPSRQVRPHIADLLRRMPDSGAVVTDATYDVIGVNPTAAALLGDLDTEPNLARRHFLKLSRTESSATQDFGEIAVARLRASADRYPHDERLRTLLAELQAQSPEFADIWASSPVRTPGHRVKTMHHPDAGPLRVNCDVLPIPDDDQWIVFITPDPGSRSARMLRHLAVAV
jgi:transcriptional regulator with XRE-family HTH domain